MTFVETTRMFHLDDCNKTHQLQLLKPRILLLWGIFVKFSKQE